MEKKPKGKEKKKLPKLVTEKDWKDFWANHSPLDYDGKKK